MGAPVEARRAETTGLPATMIAAVVRRYGGPEVVEVTEVPVPSPAAGEALVRVEAASLNAYDHHFLTGTPYVIRPAASGLWSPKHPIIGADAAGVVVALGDGGGDLCVGDAVFGEVGHGACASFVSCPVNRLAPVSSGVSFEDAAATPMAALTGLQALRTHAAVQPGERVLVNGAAGGVGTFTVQLAVALGAEVTGVCSTRNVEMVRALGASEVIDYTTDDFVEGGARFDVFVDNVGNRSPRECMSVLQPRGRYVMISGPKENKLFGPVGKVVRNRLAFRRATQSFHQFTEAPNRSDLELLDELLADGRIEPAIDRVIDLDGVADALAEIGTGHTPAKIVVRVASP